MDIHRLEGSVMLKYNACEDYCFFTATDFSHSPSSWINPFSSTHAESQHDISSAHNACKTKRFVINCFINWWLYVWNSSYGTVLPKLSEENPLGRIRRALKMHWVDRVTCEPYVKRTCKEKAPLIVHPNYRTNKREPILNTRTEHVSWKINQCTKTSHSLYTKDRQWFRKDKQFKRHTRPTISASLTKYPGEWQGSVTMHYRPTKAWSGARTIY